MRDYEEIWAFETARLRVALEVAPCPDDPRDSFEFAEEDIAFAESGDPAAWFDARVVIYGENAAEIGADYLCGCSYFSFEDFYGAHRDRDPMNRNCSIMRAANGSNVCICHYFPDMVREAIRNARHNLKYWRALLPGIKDAV